MPKQQLTVKSFNGGLVTTQPASDLLENQYSFGSDIDPSYPGGIKGRSSDESWKTGVGTNGRVSTRAELDANYQAVISDSNVYLYQDTDATGTLYSLGVTAGSNVSMEANNKAIHIGTGGSSTTPAKWLGIVSHTQFGIAPSSTPAIYNAAIEIPNTVQGYSFGLGWKGCSDNNGGYVYIDKAGKRLTRFSSTAPYFDKTSDDIFQNITAICSDPENPGDVLVYDNETSTLYRVNAGAMTVTTSTQLGYQLSKNGYLVTDMETTSSDVYLAVTAIGGFVEEVTIPNKLSENDNTIPGSFLYKIAKSNLAGTANVVDISPDLRRSSDVFAFVTTDLVTSYTSINSLDNYSIKLKLGTKCLFRTSSSTIGLYGNISMSASLAGSTVSESIYIKYQDSPPSNEYREIPSAGSFLFVTSGQPKQQLSRSNTHPVSDGLPDVVVWLSYSGTTLRRAYYNNIGGQNYHGTTTIDLSSTIGSSVSFSDTSVSTTLVKNAAMVYTGSMYYMLNGDGTLDPAARYADTSTGALVSSIGSIYLVEEPNGFTEPNTTYYYKFSLLYDGFQESPLTSVESYISPNSGKKIKISAFVPSTVSRRVSHLNIYRAQSGGIGGFAKSFYQLVETISLAPSVAETTTTFGSTSVTGRKFEYVDNFTINQLGPTYESNSGFPETTTTSTVNYGLSCQQGGYHFVADCYHSVISDAKQYIFRSAQGQFNVFNYFSNFLRLPETPVALVSFKSRIFAFSKNKIWRINPDGFYIEDEMNGFGALSATSVVTTDIGMFFAGPNGIYVSDGGAPIDISLPIIRSYSSETFSSVNPAWLNRDTTKQVSLNYDPRNKQLLVAYWPSGASNYYFLVYTVDQRRWDLWNSSEYGSSLVSAPGVTSNGIPTFWTGGGVVATIATSATTKATTYYSPYFDLREPAIEKWIYNVKLQLRDALPSTVSLQIDDETPVSLTSPVLEEGTALPSSNKDAIYRYDVPQSGGQYRKGKRFRLAVTSPAGCKIDSIDFTFREKIFKGGL
jgi:hypothetical protein